MSELKKIHGWYMPADESHLTHHMATVNQPLDGRLTYQMTKYKAAKQYVKNFRQVVDVGAHIGLWSWVMAKDFESVLSFEPVALHRECWERNMEGIENAALYDCALGEKEGSVALECRTEGSSGDTQVRFGQKGDIELKTLDSFYLQDIGLIKIDCEGYEEYVIRGAVETLTRCKPVVIVEQKRDFAQRYGLKNRGAVEHLKGMGAILRTEISGDYILSWD